ncbi:TetR family transcriptional regulator [Gordonia sp. HNM0687]|uniref:TetR family transcriptional regulator n=1 Tax=Gordonia mangrovi TaxID=2665643 RepID=A0A6L7GPR4_9ACTN|nr:TetR/AcrR family transcriptional regulator [Gordonia mangrovi]MXP21880.1 TetR family transcriptional regulator [Gordonia mangrovi]UVF76249.1 TetR/AcrR family transcriptional regulator [Gordonia mangrovi]
MARTPSGTTKAADSSAGENLRAYGGEDGGIRVARRRATLIDAALELLGASDGGSITVRGVCREAGLTTRYFYESFDSVEALVSATFDGVIGEIADLGLAAFDSGDDVEAKVRGAVGAVVAVIDEDRRKGRLLFSQALLSPTIARKRMESTEIFAALTVQSAAGVVTFKSRPRGMAAAHFQVGGLGRVLAAWLDGHLELDRDGIVDVGVGLMMALADGVARFD